LIFDFSKKSLKTNESLKIDLKKKLTIIFSILCLLYFTAILIYGNFLETTTPTYMESSWLAMRIVGIRKIFEKLML